LICLLVAVPDQPTLTTAHRALIAGGGFAADSVDLPSGDLDSAGISVGKPATTKQKPHRFGLVQWHYHTATLAPALGHAVGEVFQMPQRKCAELLPSSVIMYSRYRHLSFGQGFTVTYESDVAAGRR
jgi:hypothetical protein